MNDTTPDDLPALHEALLDDAGLDALLEDIASFAELLRIRWRGAEPAGDAASGSAETKEALRRGAITAAQIHYQHEGARWCDTLERTDEGYRLVRIRQVFREG